MSNRYEGGCTCRAVRFRLTSEPMFVHCCHCHECQRLSGSAFAIKAPIEADRVHLLRGTPRPHVVPSEEGCVQTVVRCPDCGVALWSHHPDLGEQVALVYLGTLDPGHGLAPQAHCFTRSRQPWVRIPPDVHTAEAHYALEDCWPAESLQRLDAAMEQG
ncbi:GFA family protein [Bordetella sp. 2513F-2]